MALDPQDVKEMFKQADKKVKERNTQRSLAAISKPNITININ